MQQKLMQHAAEIDSPNFSLKKILTSLKTAVHKLDIARLVPVRVGLSKLNDKVKNDVAKKTVYDKLVAKVNKIDIPGFDTIKKILNTNS